MKWNFAYSVSSGKSVEIDGVELVDFATFITENGLQVKYFTGNGICNTMDK